MFVADADADADAHTHAHVLMTSENLKSKIAAGYKATAVVTF